MSFTEDNHIIRSIYYSFILFITLLCPILVLITSSWIVYFTNNITLNYSAYKAYKLRTPDEDSLQRRKAKKELIIRDLLILGVILCEFAISISLLTELIIGSTSQDRGGFETTFNCSTNTSGSSYEFRYSLYKSGFMLEAIRQSMLIGQLGIYGTVVTFLTQVYKLRQPNMKRIYKMLAVILAEIISLLCLISFIETYIVGYTLSVAFLLLNIMFVIRSGKQLYLQIRFRLQDISLVDTMDARQEYQRTLRALVIYKQTVSFFTLLLFILALGELVFCISSIWVEWIFVIQCSKLKPAVLMVTVGEGVIRIVTLQSLVARIVQIIAGSSLYLGIIGMSIAVGVKRIIQNRRSRKLGQTRYRGLVRPLLNN